MFHRSSWPAATALPGLVATVLLLSATAAFAEPVSPAPALPAVVGSVINVSTESQLQAAMAQLRSDTTIVLAPGTYRLTRTLYIHGTFSNVGIRGATNNPDDVAIVGAGMTNASYGNVPYGIWTGGDVQAITIANLTIRDFYFHDIIFNAGTQRPLIHNVHLIDSGEQFVKSNPDGQGGGVDGGVLQYSTIEFTNRGRDDYPKGIDIHTATGWHVRHNLFRNLRAPGTTQLIGPAVLVWNGSSETTVEGNTFINCQREIMFGVNDRTPDEHTGGVIRNNMIYRDPGIFSDVGIAVFDSPDKRVLHNTILISDNYPNAIEYRYPSAVNVYIANNLVDGTIRQRDGAQAVLHNNVLTANADMFVAPAAGNLHVRANAVAAIDAGTVAAGTASDWDGEARPEGAAPDVGADEFTTTVTAPPTSPPVPPEGWTNVAAASAGATASASTTYPGYGPAGAINGDRRGANWGAGTGWNDATPGSFPDWLQVDFAGPKTISEVRVFSVQDNYTKPLEPTAAQTFSLYGLTSFTLQYWDGAQWLTVPGGTITGNQHVWRTVTFPAISTSRIRIVTTGASDSYSRLVEVEAYAAAPAVPSGVNVAAASAGATASASTTYPGYGPAGAINGDRRGANWGAGAGWNDATPGSFPDWLQVDFAGTRTISEVRLFSVQDNYSNPVEPTTTQTFSLYGITSFTVQYWDGAQWLTVPGGAITGNQHVWRTVTFPAISTSRIRIVITGTSDSYSRLTQVEAYETVAPVVPSGSNVAAASAGATASASTTYPGYGPAGAINGDRRGANWGAGTGWNDATPGGFPDWLQVDFAGPRTISEVRVFSVQDNYSNPLEPTATQTFSLYGLTSFTLQYWDGAQWLTVPGGTITGNQHVWRTVTFPAVSTARIRIVTTGASDSYSRLVEVEAY